MKKIAISAVVYMTLCAFCSFTLAASSASLGRGGPTLGGAEEAGESHASEYVMRRYPGERLIPIRILGGVRIPGTYYVPVGTDLLSLISLSGGLDPNADPSSIWLSQWKTKSSKPLDMKMAMEDPVKYNPALEANDALLVEEKKPLVSNNTMLIITAISAVVSVVVGAVYITKQ